MIDDSDPSWSPGDALADSPGGENGYDAANPARVLPLVGSEGDRQLLVEWLEDQSEYEVVEYSAPLEDCDADLCILDRQGAETHFEAIRRAKEAAAPVFLPVLLVLADPDLSVIGREGGQIADGLLESTVDEVVTAPIEQVVLAWRLRALLRLRHQTVRMRSREAELRRFKQATEATGNAVYITDAEGTIAYVNPAFESVTGFPAAEAVGETPKLLASPEMSDSDFDERWRAVFDGERWEAEVINRRKSGEEYLAHQTISPITDETGAVEAVIAVLTDITERKELETRLRRSKERYESLFTSIRDAILVADIDRRIVNCNPAFEALFGYSLAEIEGEPTSLVYESEAEFETLGAALRDHMDDPQFTVTVHYEKRSGQVFPGETNVFYLRDADDEVTGFIGLIRDVSGRRDRIEQLQIIDRVLRHNLHNDMNVITGYAETIRDSTTGETAARAETIITGAHELLETVDKERAITKFLSNPPRTERIALGPAIRGAVTRVQERYPDADLTVAVPERAAVIATTALETAITELLDNAVTHADTDDPAVEVRVEGEDGTLTIAVADEGPGIPEMEREVLTDQTEIDALFHGSGLGLWLVNRIVRHSDGVLTFEENDPQGSIVSIRLPRA